MAERDSAEFIKQFSIRDRMGATIGLKVESITEQECIGHYVVNPEHFNPNKILHGGALYAALDSCQGAFLHFILDPEFVAAATGTSTIKYFKPVTSGKIKLTTWLKNRDGRKYFIDSKAENENGETVVTLEEIWIAMKKA